MLDYKEKERINELIKLGYSDYKIGKKTGHSHNTIEPIRKEFFENLKHPESNNEVNSGSFIDKIRNIINEANEVINTNQINEKEKKELEKLIEPIKKVLKSEVDERIKTEVEKAVKKINQEWKRRIEQQYIPKEIVKQIKESYENKLKEKNNIIENIIDENKKIDYINIKNQTIYQQNLSKKQDEVDFLLNKNIFLMNENFWLNNYINIHLDKYVRFGQQALNSNIQIFNNQKNDFEDYKKRYLTFFNDLLLKMNKSQENIKIQKYNQDIAERKMNIFIEMLIEEREDIKKTRGEQKAKEQRLQKWEKQLVKKCNYLNILNIEESQNNKKIPSENSTHNEYNDIEKEKSTKIIIPRDIEQIKPTITPLNPRDFPPLDKIFGLFGQPIKHQGFFTNLNY